MTTRVLAPRGGQAEQAKRNRGVCKADIEQLLPLGRRRTYHSFARCAACGRIYWRGAHSKRLEPIVASAIRAAAAAGRAGSS